VAKAEGNTTYRLIRRVSDDGREEVLVSGRRARAERLSDPVEEAAAPADLLPEPAQDPAPPPGQQQLLDL
jgi:hypothetical protein